MFPRVDNVESETFFMPRSKDNYFHLHLMKYIIHPCKQPEQPWKCQIKPKSKENIAPAFDLLDQQLYLQINS